MNPEEIIEEWKSEIDGNFNNLHKKVLNYRKQILKKSKDITIWLGGPGKGSELHPLRELIRKILEKYNFEVIFSEEFQGGADLASKEEEELQALDLIILLSISPGASSEAIEFAHLDKIRPKFWIYFPREFRDGYTYRSLSEKHRIIGGEDTLFSLENFKKFDSELPIKIVNRAISHLSKMNLKKQICKLTNPS